MELKLVKGNMDKQDLIDEFFEKKCQVIKNAGCNQLVICNFVGIEALVEKALNKQVKEKMGTMKNNWKKELRNIYLCSCCSTDENELFDKFSDTSKSLKEMEKLIQNLLDKQIKENKKEVIEIARDIWRDMRDNPDCSYVNFKKDKVFDETEGTNLECFREGVFDFFKKLENKLKGN